MTCAYNRSTAVLNLCCTLKNYFYINKLLYNPYQVRLVEIFNTNPLTGGTAIASYTPTLESTGIYIADVVAGVLNLSNHIFFDKWYFTWKSGETETNTINDFYVSRSTALNIVGELRILLKDTHPDTTKRRYTDTELEMYLADAVLDLNVQPPAFTNYTLDNWEQYVPEWKALILKGAMIFSLISIGIFHIGLEFSYNDFGISCSFERSGKFQSWANMLLADYTKQKEAMKTQYYANRLMPRAIISAPLNAKFRSLSPRVWRYR